MTRAPQPPLMAVGVPVLVSRADGVGVEGTVLDSTATGVLVRYQAAPAGHAGSAAPQPGRIEMTVTNWFHPSAIPHGRGGTPGLLLDRFGASFVRA